MSPHPKFAKAEILRVYENHPLSLESILDRLRARGANLSALTEADLAIDKAKELTDQNHVGGLDFVRQLAASAGVSRNNSVLDLGCGLGGSARALAWLFGCRVHGIDFSAKRCRHARLLNQLVGLNHLVSIQCGDVIADSNEIGIGVRIAPEYAVMTARLPREQFDVIWGQSAWCHIADRTSLMKRWSKAMKRRGRMAIEDAVLLKRLAFRFREDFWSADQGETHYSSSPEAFRFLNFSSACLRNSSI